MTFVEGDGTWRIFRDSQSHWDRATSRCSPPLGEGRQLSLSFRHRILVDKVRKTIQTWEVSMTSPLNLKHN